MHQPTTPARTQSAMVPWLRLQQRMSSSESAFLSQTGLCVIKYQRDVTAQGLQHALWMLGVVGWGMCVGRHNFI